ncbi:MAG: porin [Byssovorax sp.]
MSDCRSHHAARFSSLFVVGALAVLSPASASAEPPTAAAAAKPGAPAGGDADKAGAPASKEPEKNIAEKALDKITSATSHWFERINMRGYSQVRYNRLFETNENLVNIQGDKSIGKNGGFLLRRARLIVFGDIHPHVSIYLQPDFASTANDQIHVAIMRDWYADLFADKDKELRFRVGQSKVPFGFENMQSSQNRAPLDRSDALNSALKDERDLGAFVYYTPKKIRARFKQLVDDGLKGSGDYGVVGLGVYNGQTANKTEKNDTPHVVARVTYPFAFGNQILEIGGGAYTGQFVVSKDKDIGGDKSFRDARAHAAIVLYPKPIGFQAEYNVGVGPELRDGVIQERFLHGGYAMVMARIGGFLPYARAVLYEGGRKFETNAPRYKVRELELGLEWQIIKPLEVTAAYTFAERTFPEAPYQQESGRFLRLQAQVNF